MSRVNWHAGVVATVCDDGGERVSVMMSSGRLLFCFWFVAGDRGIQIASARDQDLDHRLFAETESQFAFDGSWHNACHGLCWPVGGDGAQGRLRVQGERTGDRLVGWNAGVAAG